MADTYTLHLACNDERDGHYQGWCDAIELWQGTDMLLSLERNGEPMACPIGAGLLTLGALHIPFTAHRYWVDNWCWEAVTIDARQIQRVLALLEHTHWQLSAADEQGLALWNAVPAHEEGDEDGTHGDRNTSDLGDGALLG